MKTIILYGMRGTGKSSVGRLLAKELDYSFTDLDEYISNENKDAINSISTLSEYIDTVGWNEFRDEEHRCLKEVLLGVGDEDFHPLQSSVISLGGGTIAFERNREEIFTQKNTKIIYLDTDLEEIARRIAKDEDSGEKRNSLTGKSVLEELEEVYSQRKDIYKNNCDFSVDNNGEIEKTVSEIAYKLTWGGVCIPVTTPHPSPLLRGEGIKQIADFYEEIKSDRKIEYVELRLDLMFVEIVGTENFLSLQCEVLQQVIQECPKKVICTLRHENEGGKFNGTSLEQKKVLKKCLDYGAEYVDVESQNYQKLSRECRSAFPTNKLILSYHNFQETPSLQELEEVLKEMKKYSPAVYKIACMPQNLEDVEKVYNLVESIYSLSPMGGKMPGGQIGGWEFIFISMGELGLSTRVEMSKCGALLTFASYGENSSAPGQINYKTLYSKIYKQEKLFGKIIEYYDIQTLQNLEKQKSAGLNMQSNNKTLLAKRVLFLGAPQISGSLSPFMHNFSSSMLKSEQTKFFYTLTPVEVFGKNTSGSQVVQEFVEFLESDERFLGANVTMPFKIDMYYYLQSKSKRLDKRAQMVGAVNTLYKKDGKIYGTNTDIDGVKIPILKKLLGTADLQSLQGKISPLLVKEGQGVVYILGTGGAARAAIAAAIEMNFSEICILGRNIKSLTEFKKHFSGYIQDEQKIVTHVYDVARGDCFSSFFVSGAKSIVINTLPFGFKKDLPESPIRFDELDHVLMNVDLYFEAVYDAGSGDTPIVREIEKYNKNYLSYGFSKGDGVDGTKICRGQEMLIAQAQRGFELWSHGGEFQTEDIKNILLKKE